MEEDELLIECVRNFPCLYNSKNADFKVAIKKENAWKAISTELGRTSEFSFTQNILYYGILRVLNS